MQQSIADQNQIRDAMKQNPNATFGDLLPTLRGKVMPNTLLELQKADLQMQQTLAQKDDVQIKAFQAQHDAYQGIYNSAQRMSDSDFQQNWPSIAASVNSVPGGTFKVDPQQPMSKAQFSNFGPMVSLQDAYLKADADRRNKESETSKNTAQAARDTAEAAKANAEAQGLTGQFADAQYRSVLTDLAAGKQVSDERLQFAKGYELANRKTATQSDSLGVTSTNTSAPSGLAALANRMGVQTTPQGSAAPQGGSAPAGGGAATRPTAQSTRDSLVDMIGQYKMNPQIFSRAIVKHPDLLAAVGNKYPDFDQTTYNAKNKIVQDYTSGPESRSINAISTALGHAGELGEAINALGNDNGLNMLRSLGNRLGVSVFGDDRVTVFNTIVHTLAPEITQAYVQGGGGEHERAAAADDFNASLGDRQLRGNLAETIKLLRSKIAAQEQQWNNTYRPTRPQDEFSTRFLTPGAKQTLQTWGSGGGGGAAAGFTRIKASDGSLHDIPTANLDKAKQRDPNLQVMQ